MQPEVGARRPLVVVAAAPLDRRAREALAGALGPGHVVVDIREADGTADVVVAPSCSAHALAALARAFPDARLVVAEVEDDALGVHLPGPVRRALAAGADSYVLAGSVGELGSFLATQASLEPGAASALGEGAVDDLILLHAAGVARRAAAATETARPSPPA